MTDQLEHVTKMWADDRASAALGMQAQVVEVDHAVVRMTVTDTMTNGHKICHGGYVFILADSAFGIACNSAGVSTLAAGCDITFARSAELGDVLVAEARVKARFGRSGLTDVTVRRESDGVVIAEMRGRSRAVSRMP